MGVWFFNMILCLVVLLIEEVPEIFGGEGDNIGWVFLDDCLGVMFEDIGQFFRDYDLLSTVDSLFSYVGHYCNLFYYNLCSFESNPSEKYYNHTGTSAIY